MHRGRKRLEETDCQSAAGCQPKFSKCGPQSRAALLSRAERPCPACSACTAFDKADGDVGRGPGGPPHKTACAAIKRSVEIQCRLLTRAVLLPGITGRLGVRRRESIRGWFCIA